MKMISILTAFLLLLPSFASAGDARLQLPYKRHTVAAAPTQEAPAPYKCPTPNFEGMKDLVFTAVYNRDDPEKDDTDPQNKEQYRAETKGMTQFENRVLLITNAYFFAPQGTAAEKAQCALSWLHTWAENDAMLGNTNYVGVSVRHWTLASLASAFAQIRDEPTLDTEQNQKVRTWLRDVALAVAANYDSPKNKRHNNLAYWAAWSVAMAGVALDDRELYNWGIARGIKGIEQIEADGTLPLEMARGSKAFIYHQFAITPLLMIAETALANGTDLYNLNEGRLHRLAKRVLTGLQSQTYFETRTGYPQDGIKNLTSGNMAWVEVYNSRFPSHKLKTQLEELRPIFARRLGGDVTTLFARH